MQKLINDYWMPKYFKSEIIKIPSFENINDGILFLI